MSVKLKINDFGLNDLTLEKEEGVSNLSNDIHPYEEYFPELTIETDDLGRIIFFDVDLWAGPDFLDHIISYFEKHPVPGTYTVEQLGLYDVPFVEILKVIRKLYQQKLTTQTQK